MVNRLKAIAKRKPDLTIWLFVFVVTAFIALLVQLLILPVVFPAWHAFDGLLSGSDSVRFHREAIDIAENIKEEGWSAWELRPRGWMPVGVASAIYAVTWSKPWTLIPLNAAVHATTILIVAKILLLFASSRKIAFAGAMPFAFFPSAALWYAQIHRDGYHILGAVLFIYGLAKVMDYSLNKNDLNYRILPGIVLSIIGFLLIWLVRPYSLVILLAVCAVLFIFLVSYLAVNIFQGKMNFISLAVPLLSLIILVAMMIPLTGIDEAGKYQQDIFLEAEGEGLTEGQVREEDAFTWERTPWLPGEVDRLLYSVAYLRSVSYPERYGRPASAIDYDQKFLNGYDFIFYLPRALQISYLAPFPGDWFDEGSYASTSLFRRISALEMIIVYSALLFLIYGFWRWRNNIIFWLITIYSTVSMLPIVYAMPNVGTIYRYRYGYLMLMVALGIVALLELVKRFNSKRNSTRDDEVFESE